MKTYKQFNEAAVLALPALKAAPYVIPALGAGANILKGMMQSDASDRFKARQRPTGRKGKASYKDKLRAKQRQDAADKRQSLTNMDHLLRKMQESLHAVENRID